VLQPFQQTVRHDSSRDEDRQFHDGLEQLRLRVLDDDALHARHEEHAAVVAGVAGHEHLLEREVEPPAEPHERVALGRAPRQHIEVAQA